MELAQLRGTAQWVKRLVGGLLRPSLPPPVAAGGACDPPPSVVQLVKSMWPTLSALRVNSNDEAAMAAYRDLRHKLSHFLQGCPPQDLRLLLNDGAFHLFIAPVHKDIDLLPQEKNFRQALPTLLDRSRNRAKEHRRHLLAAMLYYQPYQLDARLLWDEMAAVDPVLFPVLVRYLLDMSLNYSTVGEADAHARFTESALARLAELVGTGPPSSCRDLILDAVEQQYFGDMPTANTSSLKRFFALERRFQKWLLERRVQGADLVDLKAFRPGHGKLRVGLLRVGYSLEFDVLMQPLNLLPQDRYEVHVFAMNEDGLSSARERFPNFRPHALVLGDVAASVNLLRQAGIDILINGSPLGGGFRVLVTAILQTRAAPIQVMYCSDIMTSGIAAMDYFIVGDVYLRDALAEEFTEQLVACPGLGYSFPRKPPAPVDRGAVRTELGLGGGDRLYVSSAHLFKITPELLRTWAGLLKTDRRAWLALMPVSADHMKPFARRLEKAMADACRKVGVARERILVLRIQGQEAVSRVLAAADVYLDCFPYSGPTSAVEGLLAGIPVVTLAGVTFRGSFVAGLLRTISLEQCIAGTEREYVALAKRLAENTAFRQEVCRVIHEQLPRARFFNPELVAGDLDRVLSQLAPRRSL